MRTRYPDLRGVERQVAAALLVDVSAQDRERIFKDFDSGELEFDYAVLNELSKERPRPPVSPVIVERIKTALKSTKDAYLKVNATNALSAAARP
ncbi:MAG: hypothetical protein DI536_08115 [Archangium gephyra]|uniref:Uncharacterized protein n=1 Tax=Archangium gephyra TaxID=48 RepID=A0A2W5TNK3_9BACT|nr:MAG: hypothetical protein DI536_08115 [Archangium gephyra]